MGADTRAPIEVFSSNTCPSVAAHARIANAPSGVVARVLVVSRLAPARRVSVRFRRDARAALDALAEALDARMKARRSTAVSPRARHSGGALTSNGARRVVTARLGRASRHEPGRDERGVQRRARPRGIDKCRRTTSERTGTPSEARVRVDSSAHSRSHREHHGECGRLTGRVCRAQSFLFLAAFAIERVHDLGRVRRGSLTRTQRDVWWGVIGLCAFALLGNCATQTAYVTFGPSWPRTEWQGNVLRYMGFGKLDGAIDYALFFVPYFGIALAGASKLYEDRARAAGVLDGTRAETSESSSQVALKVTVVSAAIAAVTVPSVSSMVYVLFVLAYFISELQHAGGRLGRFGGGRLRAMRERLLSLPRVATMACLCYTAIHFVAINMYQLPELQSAARKSSAQFLGLYSMDKAEGPVARLLRLTQIISIGTLFMGLCAMEAYGADLVVEDDMRRPLMEGATESESDITTQNDDVNIVARLVARFGGILTGFALLAASLLVFNVVAYPMLLLGLLLIVSPVRHSTFANVHGPIVFVYVVAWSVCEYTLLCIPPTMMPSINSKFRVILEVFGAMPSHDGEQSGLNACYMGSLMGTLALVGSLTKIAKDTPTDDDLEERVQSGKIEDYVPLDDLDIEYDPVVERATWEVPLVQLISHLLVPFTLWVVALSRADLLHAALLLAFLFNILKPGDRTILHLTAQALSAIIAVLYVWAMNAHLSIFNVQESRWKSTLSIIGLENSSTIRTTGPFACILVVICIVLYLPKVLHALAPEMEEDRTNVQGMLDSLTSLGRAIIYEFSLVCVKLVTRFGSYLILMVGLATLETSKCSLINLALLALLGLNCIVRRHAEDHDRRRWRAVLLFCLFNLAGRYAFGAFPLYELFGFSADFKTFLENTVGLPQNLETGKLMSELAGPSTLLVVTYFHDIGVLNYRDAGDERSRLPLAATELGFVPLVKRAVILHANKVVAICALVFSLERRDLLGLIMLATLIAATLSMKTTDGPTEVIGTVALITAILDYAYKIQWMQEGEHASILTILGAHKWAESSQPFMPRNESLLRYPILVIFSVELTKTTRFWLSKLPPALKSGCSPEPCHLFWPQRDTRAQLLKHKAELAEKMKEHAALPEEEAVSETSDGESDNISDQSGSNASKEARRQITRRMKNNARTNIGQISLLISLAPEMMEGMMANMMPGLLYVVFAVVGIASTNMLSILYLGVLWRLVNSKLGSSPRDRLLLWRFTAGVCALIVLWQYAVSIELVQTSVDNVPQSPPSLARSLLSTVNANERLTKETKQWLAVLPCSEMMLFGYFSAFFIAACQLRMDAILAALEERARMTIEATRAESGEDLDEETISDLIATMVPRQTPTQMALLPAQTEESSYIDILFAPLSWEASQTWTILEWVRYFYLRYAIDWALVAVIFFGTFSRDVIHLGYLILPFYFLRARKGLQKDDHTGLRLLQLYNVAVMGIVLLYQAPLEGLVGDWYASVGSDCSILQVVGLYKLPTVLGWGPGQLSSDLIVFAIVHLLRSTIVQRSYDVAMTMRLESVEAEKMMKSALQWGWIRESLKTCLSKVVEIESRRKRVEDIRNEITSLSREILAVETRGEGRRKTSGDRKPKSETLRRRHGGEHGHADEWMDEDDDENVDEVAMDAIEADAAELREYEKKMRKSGESTEKDFAALLQTWLEDQSSTVGLLFGAFLKAWPWLTAPRYSLCYFFMILAFAIDFSIIASVFPTVILAYGLMAYPTVPAGFWRFMLSYAETSLAAAYVLTIPCSMQCTTYPVCAYTNAIFGMQSSSAAFVSSVTGVFMAYVAVMIYCDAQGIPAAEIVLQEDRDRDDDGHLFAMNAMFSRFKNRQFEGIYESFDPHRSTTALLHIKATKGIIAEMDNFFQRILTQEAEYGPSFVALSILAKKGVEPDWDDIGARVNEALVRHQSLEKEDSDSPLAYYTLEFVKADPEELHRLPGHQVAIFRIIAPSSLLCPSAEASNALEALQLREAAGSLEADPLQLTSVRAFHQEGDDFYSATLFFDVLSLLFAAIFYQSTVDSDADALVETYYQGLFKIDYVTAVFILLVLIVVDGVIYMKKAKVAKVFYHYLTYAGLIGYILLIFHKKSTTHHSYLQFFFLLKALSFTLGARQIRCGFPSEVFTNSMIFQRSDVISFSAFIAYFSLPFMYELRVLLEYACTDSALDLYDWLKLENISRSLFRINVRNNTYRKLHPFGQPQPWWKKVFLEGGGLFTIIFSLLVVPFFVFSTSNPQVDVNPVFDIRFNMSLVGTENTFTYPIFDGGYRKSIETKRWMDLRTDGPAPAISKPGQIQEACLAQDSDTVWSMPPPSVAALKRSLTRGAKLTTGWVFKRHLPIDNPVLYSDGIDYTFDETQAEALVRVINGEQKSVFLEGIYPRVWHLHGKGAPVPRYSSEQAISCSLSLNDANSTSPWWTVDCGTYVAPKDGTEAARRLNWWQPCTQFENGPEIVLVSSEVPTGVFATFSQFVGGLTGVYVVYILTLSSIVRGFTNNLVGSIQHVDLPSTHRLISLCSDIYRARQVRDFVLEERLYWLLIRIYRSPAVLFEFTRTPDGSAMPERPKTA